MILHQHLPQDMRVKRALPGAQPVSGAWLRVDEAYAGQMAVRRHLLVDQRADVLACPPAAMPAAQELYDMVLELLPAHGFEITGDTALCPDGACVALDRSDPLGTLGALVQCDLCLMDKGPSDEEHHLAAAVLCFPAHWTLAEKIGKPMIRMHKPVVLYDLDVARRVQRLFDGVQVGRPLWRYNQHFEDSPDLFAPMREAQKRARPPGAAPRTDGAFYRSERQTVLRLPQSRAVLFAIHTYMLARADVVDLL